MRYIVRTLVYEIPDGNEAPLAEPVVDVTETDGDLWEAVANAQNACENTLLEKGYPV